MNILHAENAVLGSLLIENTTFNDIGDYLQPEDFNTVLHRDIYRAIQYLLATGKGADVICVPQLLATGCYGENRFEFQHDGDEAFVQVCDIANTVFTPKNIKHYAEIVKANSIDRKMIKAIENITASIREQKENRLDIAQQAFSTIADNTSSDTVIVADILNSVISKIDERQTSESEIIGTPTGFIDLDKLTNGLHGGDLTILAARPSMGKTLLAMNIAEHIAIFAKKSAVIFSLEMSKEQLLERLISSIAKIEAELIRSGKLSDEDFKKIASNIPQIHEAKLFIDDRSALSVSDIRAKCRRIMRKQKLSLIVIDYITLMSGEGENETIRIANISRGLKLLARDLNVPVIAISQLNRSLEQRTDKRPNMSDLRQSGAIEQDADLILFIYRDEIYNRNSNHAGIAEIIIAKHRNGATGTVNLIFNGQYCRFDNYSGEPITNFASTKNQPNNPFPFY